MEQVTSHFIEQERRERVVFYQTWISDVLRGEVAGVDDLTALRTRFSLDEHERRIAHDLGIDTEPIEYIRENLDSKIRGRLGEITEDILGSVFHAKLFMVGIQVGEHVLPVESLEICEERILPVVGGETYDGPIDDVLFDR